MNDTLLRARALFNTGHEVKEDCYALIELTKNETDPVLQGYHAAAIMVSSKYVLNPFKKMPVFNQGKNVLEELVSENFDAIELRYLRYTIQRNIPKMLGYYKNLEQDKTTLTEFLNASTKDEALANHVLFYLRNTKDVILEQLK